MSAIHPITAMSGVNNFDASKGGVRFVTLYRPTSNALGGGRSGDVLEGSFTDPRAVHHPILRPVSIIGRVLEDSK